MKILFLLMVLLFSAAIIRYNGMKRFIIYLTAILLLPYSISAQRSPNITANEVLALAFFILVLVFFSHRANIGRLINGTEPVFRAGRGK